MLTTVPITLYFCNVLSAFCIYTYHLNLIFHLLIYTYFAAFFTSDGMQPPGTPQVIVVKEEEGKHHYFSPPIYHLRALT